MAAQALAGDWLILGKLKLDWKYLPDAWVVNTQHLRPSRQPNMIHAISAELLIHMPDRLRDGPERF